MLVTQTELDELLDDMNQDEFPAEGGEIASGLYQHHIPWVRISGRWLFPSVPYIERHFNLLAATGCEHVIIDLEACSFLSSVALGILAELATRQIESGGALHVVGANGSVRKVIRILGLEKVFVLHDDMSAFDASLST